MQDCVHGPAMCWCSGSEIFLLWVCVINGKVREQLCSDCNSYTYVWDMVGSNLGRALAVVTANGWFNKAVPKFGGMIPAAVLVNDGIIHRFVPDVLEYFLHMSLENLKEYIRLFLQNLHL